MKPKNFLIRLGCDFTDETVIQTSKIKLRICASWSPGLTKQISDRFLPYRQFQNKQTSKMGRRYFCDYCNKTFIDELEARRKHLSSTYHIKLRNLHYEQHRDPRIILLEESQKTPCRRFLQHGECQFAGNCKYTHYSQEELWSLKQQVEWEDYEKKCKAQNVPDIPSVESWIEKYNYKHNKTENDDFIVHWSYPDHLECRTDLPPSMKKFGLDDFKMGDFNEWGL